MSVYRTSVPGSWTARLQKDPTFFGTVKTSLIDTYNDIDEFTNRKYTEHFTLKRTELISEILISLKIDWYT